MAWLRNLLIIAVLATGCAADDATGDVSEPPQSHIEGRDCPPDSILTLSNFGDPFMRDWCTGCHSAGLPEGMRQGAPVGVDFETAGGVAAYLERIYARAADDNQTMPPVSGPSLQERALLGEWLACGAP